MRFQFLLVPAALVCTPAAADYLSIAEAQQALFPGEILKPASFTLSEHDADQLTFSSGATVFRNEITAWKTDSGGWLFLDQVPGRDDRITYAVAVNHDGTLKGIEILTCLEAYSQIREPAWLAQFTGRKADQFVAVQNISGTTLSAAHIAEGVRRVLATYALFARPIGGRP